MNNATRYRQEAIGMISALYLPEANDYDLRNIHLTEMPGNELTDLDRLAFGMAENIRKLAQLGRTARWQAAIDRWARMVSASAGHERSIRHAFLQGMIYAGHASD